MATYYMYRAADHYILPLGETSFDKFYTEDGFLILEAMANNNDVTLNNFVVRRSDSKNALSIEEFLDEIEKYNLILDNR